MGPHCANVFDPRSWSDDSDAITLEVMRVVLAVGLFAIGVELPQSYMYQHAKSLLVVVVPTMVSFFSTHHTELSINLTNICLGDWMGGDCRYGPVMTVTALVSDQAS